MRRLDEDEEAGGSKGLGATLSIVQIGARPASADATCPLFCQKIQLISNHRILCQYVSQLGQYFHKLIWSGQSDDLPHRLNVFGAECVNFYLQTETDEDEHWFDQVASL